MNTVIPAKAGIQLLNQGCFLEMDPRVKHEDDEHEGEPI
jgi:hypothetical protein